MITSPFHYGTRLVLAALGSYFIAIFAGHAGEAASRVSAIRVPAPGMVMKAQLGADGTIHLLLDAPDGPRYVKSSDGGATFSAPMTIVDAASQKPGLKFSAADLAVGSDGRVHVAMGNNAWKLKLPQDQWSFHYASFAPGAKAFSPVRNLNRKPSEGFALAAGERGAVTASFLSGKLYAMTSRDSGETFTASAEINPAWNPCDCCTTAATYGADGRLALLYREETDNQRDLFVVVWDQRDGSEPLRQRISRTPWKIETCPMTYYTISRAGTGYVAAWPTKGQVYFARLNPDGTPSLTGEVKTPGTTGMRAGLLALGASDGATLIAWKNKDVLGWQLYDSNNQPQGAPGSAASPGNGAAAVVLGDGRFLVFP
jgi:hypothetical protein